MQTAAELLEWVQNVVFVLVAVWALTRWRRTGTEAARWAAATFAALATVILVGFVNDQIPEGGLADAATGLVSLAGLVGFPYLLVRFHDTFDPVPAWFRRALVGGLVALVLVAVPLVLSSEAETDGPLRSVALLLLAVTWVVPLTTISVRFWRAGRHQPTLVRRRLRLLAAATATLGLALLLVTAGQDAGDGFVVAVQLVSMLAAGLFLVGFAPPAPLRTYWRQAEERSLHDASVRLMAATTPSEVATLLVPHLQAVLAARAVALVHQGEVLAAAGLDERGAGSFEMGDGTATTHALSNGSLHVWPNPYTPFFADEQFDVLERIAVLVDLALARTGLLSREREARQELEAANAELESFVYSASHDLKSPLIAIQSYLDIFEENLAAALDDETAWYVERMRSNAQYMAALVGDLLELSRVGRVDTAPESVDLAQIVDEVAVEVRERYPGLDVHVDDLPHLWMSPLRCYQLLRNLVENAAAHAPDGHVEVWVDARTADDGRGMVVRVRDDGDGIPVEYRERIFGVFERLQAEGTDTRSTGIGLAICRKIVEGFDGRIWVTDHDGGAEFAIEFPASALDATHDPATDDNTEVPA